MGLTQHKNAVANIQEIVNLLLLRGNRSASPARARARCAATQRAGRPHDGHLGAAADEFLDALAREFDFEPPRRHGLDTVETIKAMHDGPVKVFFALGGNFLSATPDTEFTAEALRRCR
jgi:anaerobic selenocysteine-containing dehydrogenase